MSFSFDVFIMTSRHAAWLEDLEEVAPRTSRKICMKTSGSPFQ